MISIVVPTYNEKDNIAPLLKRIHDALGKIEHEVIFVDDSKDDTPEVIAEIQKKDPTADGKHASSSGTKKIKSRSTNRSSGSRRRKRWQSSANCRRFTGAWN